MSRKKIVIKFFFKNYMQDMFKTRWSGVLFLIFMAFIMLAMSTPVSMTVGMTYDYFASINQDGYLLGFILFTGSLLTFVMGIYTVLDIFFFSNDIETLMPMPFKITEIMIGKFVVTLLNMYIYTIIIVGPLISYGIAAHKGILYYLFTILVVIINPIVPLILCLLISLIFMRLTNIAKHKDMFKTISGVVSIIFILGINFFMNNSSGSTEDALSRFISENNGLMNAINGIFFTNIFASKTLLYSGSSQSILNLLILIVLTIIAAILLYYIGDKIYFKSIVGMSETSGKRENILKNNKAVMNVRSPLVTLAIKDIREIFRTPTFFMNCVVMIVYFPTLILIFSGSGLDSFIDIIKGPYIISGSVIFIALSIAGGSAASTCISREGKNIMVLKYIPIDYKTQIKSKILSSLIINSISVLLGVIVLILLKSNIQVIIMSLIIQILSLLAITIIGVYIDYSSPKLYWEDEKALFNKNFKPLIMFFLLIPIGIILILITKYIISEIIVFLFNFILLSVVSFVFYKLLMKKGIKVYENFE